MTKTILYTDGGCSGNDQPDLSKRKMVAVVSDEHGTVLIEKHEQGGSNNIAELIAVKEALLCCGVNKIPDVESATHTSNNISSALHNTECKQLNHHNLLLLLKTTPPP